MTTDAAAALSSSFTFPVAGCSNALTVSLFELPYSEGGLGWRVWTAARLLASQLAASPEFCRGKTVLELGAGVGLVGLVAHALGADVVLSDALPSLLEAMARSCALSHAAAAADSAVDAGGGAYSWPRLRVRRLLWDDDGAERCTLEPKPSGAARCQDAAAAVAAALDPASYLAAALRKASLRGEPPSDCPGLEPHETFDLVVASDVLYDFGCRRTLPRVLSRRLARPSGTAILVLPVRDSSLLDAFCVGLTREKLEWEARPTSCAGVTGCWAAGDGTMGR